jgi:peptidoglycan/LPS O-acetylase OafA/YrhL
VKSGERNIGLDILRAVAIIAVFLGHGLTLRIHNIDLLEAFGSGVELFFVLSGFLIGRIYFRSANGSFSFWNFWRSRWWRTLPPYIAAILLYVVVERIYPPLNHLHWYYGLFLQNYLGVVGFGPSWSLCVEEHFYLLLPIAGFFIGRLGGRGAFQYLLPALFVLPLLCRLALLRHAQLPFQWYWFSHLHCDGLIAGVWLAYLFVNQPLLWLRLKQPIKWLLPICPLVVLGSPLFHPRPLVADMLMNSLYALGYAAWVRWLYDLKWLPVMLAAKLTKSALVFTAVCSYSVYLTHTIFDPWIRSSIPWHRGVGKSLVVLTLTFALGVVFYFLVERPTIISRNLYLKRAPKQRKPLLEPQSEQIVNS